LANDWGSLLDWQEMVCVVSLQGLVNWHGKDVVFDGFEDGLLQVMGNLHRESDWIDGFELGDIVNTELLVELLEDDPGLLLAGGVLVVVEGLEKGFWGYGEGEVETHLLVLGDGWDGDVFGGEGSWVLPWLLLEVRLWRYGSAG